MGSAALETAPRDGPTATEGEQGLEALPSEDPGEEIWPPRIEETKKSVAAGIVVMSSASPRSVRSCFGTVPP